MTEQRTDAGNLVEGAGAARPLKFMPGVTRTPRKLRRRNHVRVFTRHTYPQSTSNKALGR